MNSPMLVGYTDRDNIERYMRSDTISYIPVWKNKRNSELYDDVMIQFEHSHITGDIVYSTRIFEYGGMIHIDNFNTAFSL
ncbi:hypothetical protein [Bacillus phage phiAGATE]|uniref:Uncharacterized protein n=1 Tax=Bacillus phage phiAGATE TaxID=1204533 RepID=L0LAB5_9CAUD|nr:hypothetical protein G380_gp002 [Bacillus phage phiAGATE]YP_008855203.1 hypothetical protein G380_gp171 [Bacillus phage phiAGATE]AGB62652.1 hypothetical protein [Bacillus phage phiAGATE]AHB12551.1 hypothetical protein [Bacillus phage phiAGATE]